MWKNNSTLTPLALCGCRLRGGWRQFIDGLRNPPFPQTGIRRKRNDLGTRGMKQMTVTNWAMVISLMVLGGNMSACALGGSASWKEEVILHDGKRLIVERSQSYGGRHEIGQKPPIKEEKITFRLPGSSQSITWTSEYGEDVGRANFEPLALHISNTTPYIVAVPNLCLAYNKWGRPNPPYVIFKYDGNDWRRVPLAELPAEFKEINLVINTTSHDAEVARQSLIHSDTVKQINSSLTQPQYKTIIREALEPGSLGVSCEELVYYKGAWVGPGDSIGRRMMDKMSK